MKKGVSVISDGLSLLNRRSVQCMRNGVMLYKEVIFPVMENASPVWRSAAHRHELKLHMLQSKCLRFATNAPFTLVRGRITKIR